MLNLFSNNVKSLFSSEKKFHKDILFSLTKMLTTVSEGYKIAFFESGIFSFVYWNAVFLTHI